MYQDVYKRQDFNRTTHYDCAPCRHLYYSGFKNGHKGKPKDKTDGVYETNQKGYFNYHNTVVGYDSVGIVF